MIIVEEITIDVLSGDTPRRLYVYVPEEAKFRPDATYPVVYMFDGHNLFFDEDSAFGTSWGLKDFLENNHVPVIVVGVECNHEGIGRLNEYSPYKANSEFGPLKGQGSIYMDWLIHELKPFIDDVYPTRPDRDHTFICGSSMGGLMSLYAAMDYSDVFSKAACLSPSVWLGSYKLKKLLRYANIHPETSVYMDMGSEELKENPVLLHRMLDMEKGFQAKNIPVRFRIIEDGTHTEASWARQMPVVFKFLLPEWHMPGKRRHYRSRRRQRNKY